MDLGGQIAIVTGGAVRLGKTLALALAGAGCDIALHFHSSREAAEETATEIRDRGVRAVTVRADFSTPDKAAKFVFERTVSELGPVAILVNSAAIFEPGTLGTTTTDQWDRQFAVNLETPFRLAREFSHRRIQGKPGQIINITDWRATRPSVGHLTYTLTKSALVSLTTILAQELAPEIQVNAIAPGAILPASQANVSEFDRLAERIPLRRTGKPADIADAMLYLLRSDFLTGEVLHVTGGEQL